MEDHTANNDWTGLDPRSLASKFHALPIILSCLKRCSLKGTETFTSEIKLLVYKDQMKIIELFSDFSNSL
jgi:hypothetical protein